MARSGKYLLLPQERDRRWERQADLVEDSTTVPILISFIIKKELCPGSIPNELFILCIYDIKIWTIVPVFLPYFEEKKANTNIAGEFQ